MRGAARSVGVAALVALASTSWLACRPELTPWEDAAVRHHVGRLSVDGDVTLPEMEIRMATLMAAPATENIWASKPEDPCMLRLDLRSVIGPGSQHKTWHGEYTEKPGDEHRKLQTTEGVQLALKAILPGGLVPVLPPRKVPVYRDDRYGRYSPTTYSVGEDDIPANPWRHESEHPGIFFASLSLPKEFERKHGGAPIPYSGAFGSLGGRVQVHYFDARFLWLSFELSMVERTDFGFPARRLTVNGAHLLGIGANYDWLRLLDPNVDDQDLAFRNAVYLCGDVAAVKQLADKRQATEKLKKYLVGLYEESLDL